MKTEPNHGAYPSSDQQVCGLTKREEFAKAAMQGLMADPTAEGTWDRLATRAVEAADALIAALNKETP